MNGRGTIDENPPRKENYDDRYAFQSRPKIVNDF